VRTGQSPGDARAKSPQIAIVPEAIKQAFDMMVFRIFDQVPDFVVIGKNVDVRE
jgi:hypothetical protein